MSTFPSLSVVVPTLGRSTLRDTLAVLARELDPRDELIVIGNSDNESACVEALPAASGFSIEYTSLPFDADRHGYDKLDLGYRTASRDYILMRGDADTILPGSFDRMRHAIATHDDFPSCPHLFAMIVRWYLEGGRRFDINGIFRRSLARHLVGAQQFVVPRDAERLNGLRWWYDDGRDVYENDHQFICGAVAAFDGRIKFHDDIVVAKETWNRGKFF